MTLSLAGVGALLAASAGAFTLLKAMGVTYLIALGLLALYRARTDDGDGGGPGRVVSPHVAFLGNLAVGTFHPKTIVFFVAFTPQFIYRAELYAPRPRW